jgi:hypothetical protein
MEIIDFSSFLVIVEDILETFPIKDVEALFDLLDAYLKMKPSVIFSNLVYF